MQKKLSLDTDTCIKCGICVSLAPEIFKFEGDLVVIASDAPIEEQEEQIQTAIDACPVTAIKWIEE
ncbi:MAG: ferredoxin [Patescibacteria group bacterium]